MAQRRVSEPGNSVWLTARPSRRRREADGGRGAGSLDRDTIVGVAVRLLDAEGVAGFTMRRLATELEVTPMSVYWYVDTKEDLLELALDVVAGEIELPDLSASDDWREDLRALAWAWRRTMLGHPWALRCYGEYLNIGPRSMQFSRHVQAVIARSPLPTAQQPAALSAVFQYVYGFTVLESRWIESARETGRSADDLLAETASNVAGMLGAQSAGGLLDRRDGLTIEAMRDQDFRRALDWLLAGMSAGAPG